MKKFNFVSMAAVLLAFIALSLTGCSGNSPSDSPAIIAELGAQTGLIIEGVGGTVTFTVNTANIGAKTYTLTVEGLPDGASAADVTLSAAGAGTLSITVDAEVEAGEYPLTLIINNTVSIEFTLKVIETPVKTVAIIGGQSGAFIIEGTGGTAIFALSTEHIAAGQYTPTMTGLPDGASAADITLNAAGVGTLSITVGSSVAADDYPLTLTIDSAVSEDFTLTVLSPGAKAVFVSGQSGAPIIGGVGGTAAFTVNTINIAAGLYTPTITGLPVGASAANITLSAAGAGTLSITVGAGVAADDYPLILTIDNAVFENITLTVLAPGAKAVFVSGQSNAPIIAGTGGTAAFTVNTFNIAAGVYTPTITGLPEGLSATDITLNAAGAGTLSITVGAGVAADDYPLTLTIDNAVSGDFTLKVLGPGAKAVFVSGQSNAPIIAGTGGTAAFTVNTFNIAAGVYTPTITGLPEGLSATDITLSAAGAGTLSITVGSSVAANDYPLTLTIDGVESGDFILKVLGPGVKAVFVSGQSGAPVIAGVGGTAAFTVNTVNIAAQTYTPAVAGLPVGASAANVTLNAAGAGTLSITVGSSVAAGDYTLTLTINGAVSEAFTLKVLDPGVKIVSVSAQSGAPIIAGTGGTATFAVSTAHIAAGVYTPAMNGLFAGTSAADITLNATGAGTLSITVGSGVTANDYTLTLIIDGAESEEFTLKVLDTSAKAVSVGSQTGAITAGLATASPHISFDVQTVNIANNIPGYTATLTWVGHGGLPQGLSVAGTVSVIANNGVLILQGNDNTLKGDYSLTLTINGATSEPFTLSVAEGEPSIQSNSGSPVMEGFTDGDAFYTFTTKNVDDGTAMSFAGWFTGIDGNTLVGDPPEGDPPPGLGSLSLSPSVFSGGAVTLIFTFTGTGAEEGEYYYKLCIESDPPVTKVFALIVLSDDNPGTGTESDPFKVRTAEDLAHVGNPTTGGGNYDGWTLAAGVYYLQTSTISLSGEWTPIGYFNGSYDGGGNKIIDLTISGDSGNNMGLFWWVNGEVKNLHLVNVNINCTGEVVGGVAGVNMGVIQNCSVSGTVKGNNDIGGVVGQNFTGGEITNCVITADVTANEYCAGGVAARNSGVIQNCITTGAIQASDSAGGIVGYNTGVIQNCIAMGAIQASSSAGGIAGYSSVIVKDCAALNSGINVDPEQPKTRIADGTGLTNNYGLFGMNSGEWDWSDNPNSVNGGNMTEADAKTASTWNTGDLWSGGPWSSAIWDIVDGSYPTLK